MFKDLKDGESCEMQGSGKKPYILKNTGGTYNCTCPAWRNQSTGIEKRTCKHLIKLRGQVAEELRCNKTVEVKPEETSKYVPELLLAERWDGVQNLAGWWISTKFDGVRAYWDGKDFYSRLGNKFYVPDYFKEGLPEVPLDGELWEGRGLFQKTSGEVRRQDYGDHWKNKRFIVFDAPSDKPFEKRLTTIHELTQNANYAVPACFEKLTSTNPVKILKEMLDRVVKLGDEGLMAREPGSLYVGTRSSTLLKIKSFIDDDAVVTGYTQGKGKYKGMTGALEVVWKGINFELGTGLSDKERKNPPKIGTTVIFRYTGLTDAGIPKFAAFIGERAD